MTVKAMDLNLYIKSRIKEKGETKWIERLEI